MVAHKKIKGVEMNDVGKEIKDLLLEKSMSQTAAARLLKIRQPFFNEVLAGKRLIPPHVAARIDENFGIDCGRIHPWMGDLKRLAVQQYKKAQKANRKPKT